MCSWADSATRDCGTLDWYVNRWFNLHIKPHTISILDIISSTSAAVNGLTICFHVLVDQWLHIGAGSWTISPQKNRRWIVKGFNPSTAGFRNHSIWDNPGVHKIVVIFSCQATDHNAMNIISSCKTLEYSSLEWIEPPTYYVNYEHSNVWV